KGADGAQVDLLIDRSDHVINLCEIKFYTLEFTIEKSYAGVLQRKLTVFKQKTGTRKTVLLTMVTTYGLKENEYSRKLVDKSLSMDVLFE
ncbi:MAG: ATP-binding protein, partial [Flavisolibacter sp.]